MDPLTAHRQHRCGPAAAAGTFLGRRAADRNATTTLANLLLLVALGLLYLLGSRASLAALVVCAAALPATWATRRLKPTDVADQRQPAAGIAELPTVSEARPA